MAFDRNCYIFRVVLLLIAAVAASACNRDYDESGGGLLPVIDFGSADGLFTVKPGEVLRIDPVVTNAEGATYTWTLDDDIRIADTRVLNYSWTECGTHYLRLTVETAAGATTDEVRVEVVEQTPPLIALPFVGDRLYLLTRTDHTIAPRFQHADLPGFNVEWSINSEVVASGADCTTYTFRSDEPGTFDVVITASNDDGTTSLHFVIEAVDEMPRSISFAPLSATDPSTTRYTFPGRPVCVYAECRGMATEELSWSIDGEDVGSTSGQYFTFTPAVPGTYIIGVEANGYRAETEVVCVDASEQSRRRPTTAQSSPYASTVFDYTPAPGQFIGDASAAGGMPATIVTAEAACQWAAERLEQRLFVSLGAWGGYIVVGFDHSVECGSALYDLAVGGNSYRESNEAGIVWVMQDVNGNGRPDDQWYELKGSDYEAPTTIKHYSVSYFRPPGPEMSVDWIDCFGTTGMVDYIYSQHRQPYYYPAWIEAGSYTLRGTRLAARNRLNPVTSQWVNDPFDWGYADNAGTDNLSAASTDGSGQTTGLRAANAVLADGTPIALQYVDFVMIQTGAMAQSGLLGEFSTEVRSVADYSMIYQ